MFDIGFTELLLIGLVALVGLVVLSVDSNSAVVSQKLVSEIT